MKVIKPLQQAFRTLLAANNAVKAIVGDKIRPDTLDEGDRLPAIVIEVPEDNPAQTLGGDQDGGTASVQIVCCAHQRPDALSLGTAVRDALKAIGEQQVGDVFLDEVTYDGVNRDYEPPEDWGNEGGWYFEPLRYFVIYG